MVTINLINLHSRIFYIHEKILKQSLSNEKNLPLNKTFATMPICCKKCDPRLVSRYEWHKQTYKMIVLKQSYFIIYIQNDARSSLCKLELKVLHIGPTLHTTWIVPIIVSNNTSPSKLDLPFPYILYMWMIKYVFKTNYGWVKIPSLRSNPRPFISVMSQIEVIIRSSIHHENFNTMAFKLQVTTHIYLSLMTYSLSQGTPPWAFIGTMIP
jgi:hypothetical protein